jgi:branched-chain amino acid transport system substrate-binding protein
MGLLAVACTEPADDAVSTTAPPATTAAPASTAPTDTTVPSDTTAPTTAPPSTIAPPSGEPFVVGVVNTEGAPGLDFPEFANAFRAAAALANAELGGFGGRPVELEVCVAKGSPESSQACAQELAAKGVDLAMIGFDIFVDYPTFAAAGIPVIGAVPILPPDYSADAVYITAGNLVVQGSTANAITNPKYLGLTKVAIIANDSAATVSALASLEPALAKGGASVTVIKGGEN